MTKKATTKKATTKKATAQKATAQKATTKGEGSGFTAEERAAMKERAAEVREQKKGGKGAARREKDVAAVLEKIAEMPSAEREIATRLHEVVTEVAPHLDPKTWYGMPGYAKDGKVLVFFQSAEKFSTRYSTIGFNDNAALDDGDLWPSAYAVTAFTPAVEERVRALVATAAG